MDERFPPSVHLGSGPERNGERGGWSRGLLWVRPSGGAAHFAAYDGKGNVVALIDGSTGSASARYVIAGKHRNRPRQLQPLVTFGGDGPTEEFKTWNWDRIREEIYQGRGA